MEWFRLYHNLIDDKKLARISRETEISYPVVLGFWVGLLCLASQSPSRGKLLLSEGIPITECDVSETLHVTLHETQKLLHAFQGVSCLHKEGDCWVVSSWSSRQFSADNSTLRVRKYREKQRENETLHGSFGNVSETGPDTDTDTDTEGNSVLCCNGQIDETKGNVSETLHSLLSGSTAVADTGADCEALIAEWRTFATNAEIRAAINACANSKVHSRVNWIRTRLRNQSQQQEKPKGGSKSANTYGR